MKTLTIPARDGCALGATLFGQAAASGSPERVVVIHSATAVPQRFYFGFARHLASRQVAVLTYDYRGIGASRPQGVRFRDVRASMLEWARLDADGVHDWVRRAYPEASVSVLGHSFGGQILGLLENASHIQSAVLVATQSGYWRHMKPAVQPAMLFYWYVAFPFFLASLGYVPMKRLGAGEDLPREVARQWSRWCRQPDYFFGELGEKELRAYKAFPAPILALSFTDDSYAGPEAVRRLLDKYPGARVELRRVAPGDVGAREIGHFGFFKTKFRESLWEQAADWLLLPRASRN